MPIELYLCHPLSLCAAKLVTAVQGALAEGRVKQQAIWGSDFCHFGSRRTWTDKSRARGTKLVVLVGKNSGRATGVWSGSDLFTEPLSDFARAIRRKPLPVSNY